MHFSPVSPFFHPQTLEKVRTIKWQGRAFGNGMNQLGQISFPPSGAVNALKGIPVEGPGGRWVPCATALENGAFVACLYEVGPGRRQVCGDGTPRASAVDALTRAIELAEIAAA